MPATPVYLPSGHDVPGRQMAAEMAEQPASLERLLRRRHELGEELRQLVPQPLAGTVLVARGSSDHAATCGAYFLEMATHRPVASSSPSVLNLYRSPTDYSGYLLVAVSQSGQTPEIVEVVDQARERGARAVAITNDPASPLANAADMVVDLGVGQENAVPATKTVTAQVVAFAIVAQALGDIGFDDRAASELPGQLAEVLSDWSVPEQLAAWLSGADRLVTVARGLLYGAACETALKLSETTSLFATAYSAADLRHGPIAMASNGPPVLALAHPGPAFSDVVEVVTELRNRGADARLLAPSGLTEPSPGTAAAPSPGPTGGKGYPDLASWPAAAPETVAPVLAIARGQQLSLALARLLGRDPDAPPGLTKVTIT